MIHAAEHKARPALNRFWSGVVLMVWLMTLISCAALAAMALITCGDIVLRLFRIPAKGAYDLVRLCGAVCVSCAVPLTTAMKGHVAIEYFFHKLGRRGRVVVDSVMRVVMLAGFAAAAWACFGYGMSFLRNSAVTDTIEFPVFWVPWLMAAAFAVTVLVILFHLICPGRELIRS
jgi:TRAP-type C4-dicarboxylate transport system permease small subunit